MKKIILLLFIAFLINACQNKGENMTISREKMANILLDIHLAETAASNLSAQKKDSMTAIYYQQIYQIHNIQEQEFKNNLNILKYNPEEMNKVYLLVTDSLEAKGKRLGH